MPHALMLHLSGGPGTRSYSPYSVCFSGESDGETGVVDTVVGLRVVVHFALPLETRETQTLQGHSFLPIANCWRRVFGACDAASEVTPVRTIHATGYWPGISRRSVIVTNMQQTDGAPGGEMRSSAWYPCLGVITHMWWADREQNDIACVRQSAHSATSNDVVSRSASTSRGMFSSLPQEMRR
nr:hypothetical protein CFP56_07430 [Quercus suber]